VRGHEVEAAHGGRREPPAAVCVVHGDGADAGCAGAAGGGVEEGGDDVGGEPGSGDEGEGEAGESVALEGVVVGRAVVESDHGGAAHPRERSGVADAAVAVAVAAKGDEYTGDEYARRPGRRAGKEGGALGAPPEACGALVASPHFEEGDVGG
jgi:hypothetical protein